MRLSKHTAKCYNVLRLVSLCFLHTWANPFLYNSVSVVIKRFPHVRGRESQRAVSTIAHMSCHQTTQCCDALAFFTRLTAFDSLYTVYNTYVLRNMNMLHQQSFSCAWLMKISAQRRVTQTLCAGCSKAEPKIFAPPRGRRPPSRRRGTAKI